MGLTLSLQGDLLRAREHLKRARVLMQQFAGKKYRIDLYPLFPLGREIRFRLTGK